MRLKTVFNYTSLLRVRQWIKNSFIFLPIFFGKQFLNSGNLWLASIAFISFSLIASSVYCLNDIIDIEFDKKHHAKKNRALANGAISIFKAKICMIICLSLGLLISYFSVNIWLSLILLSYLGINILYTYILKKIIVLDVSIIAVSFILRLLAGSVSTDIDLSHWIIIMVALLALFLGFAKRRDEYLIFKDDKIKVRKNIDNYSLKIIDTLLIAISIAIIVYYFAYSFSSEIEAQFRNNYIWLTSIFVILGLLRYIKLIKLRVYHANPTKIIFTDFFLQLIIIGWLISFYIIIYT